MQTSPSPAPVSTPASAPAAAPAPTAPGGGGNVTREVIGAPIGSSAAASTATAGGTGAAGSGAEGKPLVPSSTAPATGAQGGPGGAPGLSMFLPFLLITGFFVLMIAMQFFGGRKEKKRRDEMLTSLSRNDRVLTSGGIIGQVAEVHDAELVLTTDASSNTRIRIMKSAVQSVLQRSGAGAGAGATKA